MRQMIGIDLEQLVFMDETSTVEEWPRLRARAPSGQEAKCYEYSTRPKRETLVAALGHDRILAPQSFSGALNKERFLAWLQILRPQLGPNQVLVLDNLKVHHARVVQEWLEHNPIRLIFLPPYSPHFNPIERLWALLKARLRKERLKGFVDIHQRLHPLLSELAQQHGQALFRGCGYTPLSRL